MTLRDAIASDVGSVFLSTDEFAESIVYHPRAGGSRSILAIVDRSPPAVLDAEGLVVQISFMVFVANSASTGISMQEIDTGGDRIALARKEGDVTTDQRPIWQVVMQDSGMLQLAIK